MSYIFTLQAFMQNIWLKVTLRNIRSSTHFTGKICNLARDQKYCAILRNIRSSAHFPAQNLDKGQECCAIMRNIPSSATLPPKILKFDQGAKYVAQYCAIVYVFICSNMFMTHHCAIAHVFTFILKHVYD